MAWKNKNVKKRDFEDYYRTGCRNVTVSNNSPIQDYIHPDDHTQPTHEKNYYCDDQIQAFVEQAVVKTHSQAWPPLGKLQNVSYEFDWTFSVKRDYE